MSIQMIVSIMQPAYLPWLGYFHRMWMSDLHIVLDDVRIDLNSATKFTNRNRFRTADGWCWLTVPLETKRPQADLRINRLVIANATKWRKKHCGTLFHCYRRAPFFDDYFSALESHYLLHQERLLDLIEPTSWLLKQWLGISTPIKKSSEMSVHGNKSDLILNLCRTVGASVYLSGPFGKGYLDEGRFRDHGIAVKYHEFNHPTYHQAFSGFQANMSALDLLMNMGSQSLKCLTE